MPGGREFERYMHAVNYGFDARQGYVQQTGDKSSLRQRLAAAKGNTSSNGTVTSSNENLTLSSPDKSNTKNRPKSEQASSGFCATLTEYFPPPGTKKGKDKGSPDSEEYVDAESTDNAQ